MHYFLEESILFFSFSLFQVTLIYEHLKMSGIHCKSEKLLEFYPVKIIESEKKNNNQWKAQGSIYSSLCEIIRNAPLLFSRISF